MYFKVAGTWSADPTQTTCVVQTDEGKVIFLLKKYDQTTMVGW